jgi:eukaryotic-like serine/threonine-protein kinase
MAVWKLKPSEPRPVMRFGFALPEEHQFDDLWFPVLAVSPDGKQFAYSTSKGLYLRSADEMAAKLIPGTEGEPAQQPFFSPDGKWIGYYARAEDKLKKVRITGGVPVALCNVGSLLGASWGADGAIVYGSFDSGIMKISADGGTPRSITSRTPGLPLFPQILPGGKAVLYTAAVNFNIAQMRIMVQPLKSGEPKELLAGAMARYLPTGHLIYRTAKSNNLFTVSFDLEKQAIADGAVPIVEGVFNAGGSLQYSVSEAGTLIYMPGAAGAVESQRPLVWVNREGKEEGLRAQAGYYQTPRISPDGKRVALAKSTDGIPQIYVWDLLRETMIRLTFDKYTNLRPIWTPDGKRIIFMSIRDGKYGIYWKAADGTREVKTLAASKDLNLLSYACSGDGETITIEESDSSFTRFSIGILSLGKDHSRKMLLSEEDGQAAFRSEFLQPGNIPNF